MNVMKCCLNGNQTREYLQKADQIKILYKNRKSIIDLIEDYPNADIIVDIPNEVEEIDWNFFVNMDAVHNGKNSKKIWSFR